VRRRAARPLARRAHERGHRPRAHELVGRLLGVSAWALGAGARGWPLGAGRSGLAARGWPLGAGRSGLAARGWALRAGRSGLGAQGWALGWARGSTRWAALAGSLIGLRRLRFARCSRSAAAASGR